jgi:hypothetical protein
LCGQAWRKLTGDVWILYDGGERKLGRGISRAASPDPDVPALRSEFNKDDFPTLGIPATSTLISLLASLFSVAIAIIGINPKPSMSCNEVVRIYAGIQTYEGIMQGSNGSRVRGGGEVYLVVKVSA